MTTDALFNLPAVLSAQIWGKTASAFLYSFEYKGSTSKGINFLRGLPIVSANNLNEGNNFTAHGDELGYIFNANDLEGNPLPEARLTKAEDLKVRKNLVLLLTTFAKPTGQNGNSIFRGVGAGGDGTPFIKIDTDLELSGDFRVCELLLWGAPLKPLSSTTCQGLASTLGSVTNVLYNVTTGLTDAIGLSGPRKPGGGLLNAGGLLG